MNIDLKAYIPKTLPPVPKLDMKQLKQIISLIDKPALIKGFGAVITFYALMHLYVWMMSASTIKHLEEQLPSITTAITKAEAKSGPTADLDMEVRNNFLIEGLSQNTSEGKLPIIRSSDYLTSFRAYQTPFTWNTNSKKPVIAFILKDYGLSQKSSNLATRVLPSEISLMLTPYANSPSRWVAQAHNNGHEVWMHIPLQNTQTTDSGPMTIFHHASLNDKQTTIYQTLSKTLGYVGVSAYTDQGLDRAKDDYTQIFDELYSRGIGYFEINPEAPEIIKGSAFAKGAPYIKANIEILRMSGDQSYDTLEDIAQQKGYAVAIIPSHPTAINNLSIWLEKIGNIDYQIAPISAIYDLPTLENIDPAALESKDFIDPEKDHYDAGNSHNH